MPFDINEMKAALEFGGARPTLFEVNIINPAQSEADFKVPFLVRSSQLPPSTLGSIAIPYYGRTAKNAGDRTFDNWTVTVMNDEDFIIRNAIEEWSNSINNVRTNARALAFPNQYKADAFVIQYGQTGLPIREYKFVGIWPQDVAAIPLDWEQTDQIEQFDVSFSVDYWTLENDYGLNSGLTDQA